MCFPPSGHGTRGHCNPGDSMEARASISLDKLSSFHIRSSANKKVSIVALAWKLPKWPRALSEKHGTAENWLYQAEHTSRTLLDSERE